MTWPFFNPAVEIFRVEVRLNGVHVAAEFGAGERQREEQLPAGGRIDRIVDAVVGVGRA